MMDKYRSFSRSPTPPLKPVHVRLTPSPSFDDLSSSSRSSSPLEWSKYKPHEFEPTERSSSPISWFSNEYRLGKCLQQLSGRDTEDLFKHMGGLNYQDIAREIRQDIVRKAREKSRYRLDSDLSLSLIHDEEAWAIASVGRSSREQCSKRPLEHDHLDTVSSNSFNPIRTIQKLDLPIIIGSETLISQPDSGAEENIIALTTVLRLGLAVDAAPEHQKTFRIANGTLVKAIGRINVSCAFARDRGVKLCCIFYVFQHLIYPILMGMPFLNETRTLEKYRYRLQARTASTAASILPGERAAKACQC